MRTRTLVAVLLTLLLVGCGDSSPDKTTTTADAPPKTTQIPGKKTTPTVPKKPTKTTSTVPQKPTKTTQTLPQPAPKPTAVPSGSAAQKKDALLGTYVRINRAIAADDVSICTVYYTPAGSKSVYPDGTCPDGIHTIANTYKTLNESQKQRADRELTRKYLASTITKITLSGSKATVVRENKGTTEGRTVTRIATDTWVYSGMWKLDKRVILFK